MPGQATWRTKSRDRFLWGAWARLKNLLAQAWLLTQRKKHDLLGGTQVRPIDDGFGLIGGIKQSFLWMQESVLPHMRRDGRRKFVVGQIWSQ